MKPIARRTVVAALAFAAVALQLAWPARAQPGSAAAKWQPFEYSPGQFKVAFPGAPVMKKGKLRTEIGEVVSIRHTASDSTDATYDVTYNDYPKAGIAKLSADKLIHAARDGLVYQAKGKLVSDKPLTMSGRPARDVEIAGENGMRYRIRLLLVENRLYQLTAMAQPPAQADERRFFDSFQLTGVIRP